MQRCCQTGQVLACHFTSEGCRRNECAVSGPQAILVQVRLRQPLSQPLRHFHRDSVAQQRPPVRLHAAHKGVVRLCCRVMTMILQRQVLQLHTAICLHTQMPYGVAITALQKTIPVKCCSELMKKQSGMTEVQMRTVAIATTSTCDLILCTGRRPRRCVQGTSQCHVQQDKHSLLCAPALHLGDSESNARICQGPL